MAKIIDIDKNLCFAMQKKMFKEAPKILIASYKINNKEVGPLHGKDYLFSRSKYFHLLLAPIKRIHIFNWILR